MSIFSTFKKNFIHVMELHGRRAAHQELIKMSDRRLEDFGIAPHLLREGISAWPWKVEPDTAIAFSVENAESDTVVDQLKKSPGITQIVPAVRKSAAIKRAIDELSSYSDRELAELGVTRNSIEEAVRFGRPAVEGTSSQQRQVA